MPALLMQYLHDFSTARDYLLMTQTNHKVLENPTSHKSTIDQKHCRSIAYQWNFGNKYTQTYRFLSIALQCTRFNSKTSVGYLALLIPVLTEPCPELRLIEERRTRYWNMRERISRDRLIVDERESMKVVIETFYFYQGEQMPFLPKFPQRPPFKPCSMQVFLKNILYYATPRHVTPRHACPEPDK